VGTFHDDKGELHGITVVVETTGPRVYVGRCDTQTPQGIILLDADDTTALGAPAQQALGLADLGDSASHPRADCRNEVVPLQRSAIAGEPGQLTELMSRRTKSRSPSKRGRLLRAGVFPLPQLFGERKK